MKSKSVLLADEMGLGKTIQIASVINSIPIDTALIICPSQLKLMWRDTLEKWLTRKTPIHVFGSGRPFRVERGISVINYDWLSKLKDQMRGMTWDLLVLDESHYIKNSRAARTRAILKISAHRKIFATGTPVLNKPEELWTSLKFLWPEIWDNWHWFVTTFCNAHHDRFGYNTSGASNLELLNKLLRASGMIRRTKAQVLKELPPKFHQVIEVPCLAAELINKEIMWYKRFVDAKRRVVDLQKSSARHDSLEHRERLRRLRQDVLLAFSELSKARHDTAVYKIPTVIAHLKSCIDASKIVCFVHHRDVADALRSEFERESVILIGGMNEAAKHSAVHRFQNDANCRLFIGSISAAGTGLTLTESAHVVCAELDWTPAKMNQAIDRCHRIGQTKHVLAQYIVLEGSVDAMLARKIADKEDIIDKIME